MKKLAINKNSSIRASPSPRHCLFPVENGMSSSIFFNFPFSSMNLSGLNVLWSGNVFSSFMTVLICATTPVPLGILYPLITVSLVVACWVFKGTRLVHRWDSWKGLVGRYKLGKKSVSKVEKLRSWILSTYIDERIHVWEIILIGSSYQSAVVINRLPITLSNSSWIFSWTFRLCKRKLIAQVVVLVVVPSPANHKSMHMLTSWTSLKKKQVVSVLI